ncbi:hypothetical protein MJO28_003862 [Puccinia striiformis f. sp. tritici]|uniref:Homeobox domain-containing protein n=2 Tax=Puccinia striiformis TaxID=27350 RepID=A0A2S4VJB7_9BASI|nr:hypothetical protein MJO28_003862 [Puccinia striiformis f. sp. tritici]POW09643.1 hypothetical protein PSTT_06651 [Puccinia striiformis]
MVTAWWNSTCAPALKLRSLTAKILPPSFVDLFMKGDQDDAIPPLHFPELGNLLEPLLQLGLTAHHANLLHDEFTSTVQRLDASLSESYRTNAPQFRNNVHGPKTSRTAFIEASQSQFLVVRSQSIQRLWNTLLAHVQTLQRVEPVQSTSRTGTPSSSSPSTKPRGRAPKFSKEQTAALNALLARDNQFSSEEKDLIAHELNLTRDQVNRWFCNARARKKPYTCPSRRAGTTTKTILSSNNSTRSDSPSTHSERSYSQGSPQSSSSEDTEMSITNTSSPSPSSSSSSLSISPSSSSYLSTSSTTPIEDDPMEAYFDFPAYQPTETWPQQNHQQQETPYLPPLPSQLNYQQRQQQALLPLPSQQNYYHQPFDRNSPYNSVSGSSSCDESQFSNHSSSPSNTSIGQGLWSDDPQPQLPADFNFTPFVCS